MAPDIIIIDGNNVFHRMYFAHKDLTFTANGTTFYTGMLYGVIKDLILMKEKYPKAKIYYCLDSILPLKKRIMYDQYKANRSKKEDSFISAFGLTIQALTLLGVNIVKAQHYEADDLIYTIYLICKSDNMNPQKMLIVSNDHDMYQMLRKGVRILHKKQKGIEEIVSKKMFVERFGISPRKYLQVMALTGCSGDNVPGIDGIAEKTAIKLLNKYENLIKLGINMHKIEGKIGENLRKDWENVERNMKLLKLLEVESKDLSIMKKKPDLKSLKWLFKQVGFRQYLLPDNWKRIENITK